MSRHRGPPPPVARCRPRRRRASARRRRREWDPAPVRPAPPTPRAAAAPARATAPTTPPWTAAAGTAPEEMAALRELAASTPSRRRSCRRRSEARPRRAGNVGPPGPDRSSVGRARRRARGAFREDSSPYRLGRARLPVRDRTRRARPEEARRALSRGRWPATSPPPPRSAREPPPATPGTAAASPPSPRARGGSTTRSPSRRRRLGEALASRRRSRAESRERSRPT